MAICTFDLKNATSADYQTAYTELERIGLRKVHKSDKGGDVVVPTTAAMGEFNGATSATVRDYVRDKIRSAFATRGLRSEILVVVGASWAWGAATT